MQPRICAGGICVRLALLAVGAVGDGAAAVERPVVDVIVMAGQSNLSGRGEARELPEKFQSPPTATYFDYVCSFGGPAHPDVHRSNGWAKLIPRAKHENTPGEHFGPEVSFGHALAAARPDAVTALITHGRGATSLAEDWNPAATTGAQFYRALLAQVRAALGRLDAEGRRARLRAFIWVQGEADSTQGVWARAYADNLRVFIRRIRQDLETTELPFIVVLTGRGATNPKMTESAAVRAAQRKIAAEEARVSLVEGDDLTLIDSVHYDAGGQLRLGERLARAYLALEPAAR